MTILDLFDGALAERADAFAYDELGHGALHAGARRVATRFAELGLRRGDRIVLYSENRVGQSIDLDGWAGGALLDKSMAPLAEEFRHAEKFLVFRGSQGKPGRFFFFRETKAWRRRRRIREY